MNVLVNSTTPNSTSDTNTSTISTSGEQEREETLNHTMFIVKMEERGFSAVLIVGSIIVLIGSLLHSLMFVLSDMSMSIMVHQHDSLESGPSSTMDDGNEKNRDGIPGEIWSCCLGILEVAFMIVWVVFGILTSGFDDEYHNEVIEDSDIQHRAFFSNHILKVILGLMTLTTISCLHAASFFKLLKNLGAVASALLKGVQAVVVVLLSAVLYCPIESSQCLSWSKFISMMIVISGVFGYGLGSRKNLPKSTSRSSLELVRERWETESLKDSVFD
jgi:magnesium-transporting ATPase (P-type)